VEDLVSFSRIRKNFWQARCQAVKSKHNTKTNRVRSSIYRSFLMRNIGEVQEVLGSPVLANFTLARHVVTVPVRKNVAQRLLQQGATPLGRPWAVRHLIRRGGAFLILSRRSKRGMELAGSASLDSGATNPEGQKERRPAPRQTSAPYTPKGSWEGGFLT